MFSRKMMLTRIIIAIFVVILFGTQAYAELYMSISGAIKDATTGKGIAGVEVVAGDLTTKKNYSAVTDNNGIYYIKLVPAGEYTLYAHPSAKYVFKPYTKTVTVEKGKNVVNANFEMPLGGAVIGAIYKSDGTPLANASLFALTNKGVAISSTGTDGKYLLAGLVPESGARIKLITYGYGMIEASNVNITAGQVTSNVNITIPLATSGIRGKVYTNDSVNIPVADAFVVMKGDTSFGITTTDSNGNYSINGLPEGAYEATVFKIGFAPKKLTNVTITKNQYSNKNYYLMEQPLTLALASIENEHIDLMTVKFAINNPEYPEVELQFVSSGTCRCTSVSFTSVIGIGVSVGQAICKCSQSCGSQECVSWKNVNIMCTCLGVGISASLNMLQYCWTPPTTGISEGFQLDFPLPRTGATGSLNGDCVGGGVGPGAGIYYCSCLTSVSPW